MDEEMPPSTRLVNLDEAGSSMAENVSSSGYAALSYCWGPKGNPVQLTAATLASPQQGISSRTLPATIRDVIRLCALIGIKYLWVDALCILQDDSHDKQVELAKMAQYYHNNNITICAASAAGALDGLQSQHARPVHKYGPIQIATELGGQPGRMLLHSNTPDIAEPTTTRGWTLQQSLLSRRILTCSNQLYFCCATANAECEGPYRELSREPDRNFSYPKSLVPNIHPAAVWRVYPLINQWEYGVIEFSKRIISFADDKLPAISGLATMMHAKMRAVDTEFTGDPRIQRRYPVEFEGKVLHYLAGIFVSYDDQTVNTRSLLWRTAMADSVRCTAYRAPTWSWACLDGPIVSFQGSSELERTVVRLVKHHYLPVMPSNPYGSVRHASIHVSAPIRPAADNASLLPEAPPRWSVWPDKPGDGFAFFPDTEADLAYLKRMLERGSEDACLLLVAHHKSIHRQEGLIVSRCEHEDARAGHDQELATFVRRGYFTLGFEHRLHSKVAEQTLERMRSFFEVGAMTVRLV